MACRLSFVVCVFDFEIFAAEKATVIKNGAKTLTDF